MDFLSIADPYPRLGLSNSAVDFRLIRPTPQRIYDPLRPFRGHRFDAARLPHGAENRVLSGDIPELNVRLGLSWRLIDDADSGRTAADPITERRPRADPRG
jgi:hypothetical protein